MKNKRDRSKRDKKNVVDGLWRQVGLVYVGCLLVVEGGTLYWDGTDRTSDANGGNGTWDMVAANWDSLATVGVDTVWSSANVARFGGEAGLVTVSSGLTAQRLEFTTTGYRLNGGSLTLNGGGNGTTNPAFQVNSGVIATVNSQVSTTTGETWLRGGGTLVLGNASNAINGSLVIQGGSTLEIADVAVISSSNGSMMGFNGAGNSIRYTGPSASFSRLAAAWGLSNGVNGIEVTQADTVLSMDQAFVNNSGVSGVFKAGGGVLKLLGNTSFTGGLQIREGVLQVGGANGRIASQAVSLGNGTGSGKWVIGDAQNVKSLQVTNLTTVGSSGMNAVVGGGEGMNTLTIQTNTYGNFTGRIGGDGVGENSLQWVKSGGGCLTLTGTNTIKGTVTIREGLLGIRYGSELGSPEAVVENQVILNGGVLANLTDATAVDSFGSGWSPTVPKNVGMYLGSAGGTIRVGYGASRVFTILGDLSGPGGLTKTDSGTLVLSGRNHYLGNTTVNAGTLMISDQGVMVFQVSDAGAQTIGGSGAVRINGGFEIDVSRVTQTQGTWVLVDGNVLSESYGNGFRVMGDGWRKDVTMWYRRDGERMWSYAQSTGELKVEPVGSYPSWACGFEYGQAEVDISITGDPDGDGVMNGAEHVFGTAPNDGVGVNDTVRAQDGQVDWEHPLNTNVSSQVRYTYEWSTDLSEWVGSGLANGRGEVADLVVSSVVGGRALVQGKLRGGGKRMFVRMAVESTSTQALPRGWYFSKKQYIPEELPVYANVQGLLPEPEWDSQSGYQTMYWKCWQLAFSHLRKPTLTSPMVSNWLDEAFSANIFQWDTCFMMMFARYGHYQFPAIQSLDNFYALQRGSGYICREYTEADGAEFHWADEGGNLPSGWKNTINPPIFGWAETENYKVTGDKTRFASVLPVLEKYVAWLNRDGDPSDTDMDRSGRRSRGTPHDLYWNTGLGCGMDNTPKPTGAGAGWVDMSCQMVMQYNDLATIYRELGMVDKALVAEAEAKAIAGRINAWCWDEVDGFYYDVDAQGLKFKKKTASGFWPLISGVANAAQAARLVEHLQNPNEFWRATVFPTLSADEPEYRADGGYWLGGVWAPTNYMIIKGLERYGYDEFAALATERYLAAMSSVFQSTGTVWENYAPESWLKGNPSKGDFVGWSGCGPIALYIENVLGFRPSGAKNELVWHLRIRDAHGIKRLRFGHVVSDLRYDGNGQVRVQSNQAYALVIHGVRYEVGVGETVISCWPK